MKKRYQLLAVLCINLLLFSCFPDKDDRDGKFMREVVNLTEFNSESDDYNSNLPSNKYGESYLIFSSKRENKSYYNLVSFPVKIDYDDTKEIPLLSRYSNGNLDIYMENTFITTFIGGVNGNFNVLGPYVVTRDNLISYGSLPKYQFLFYADDKEKDLNIKVLYSDKDGKTTGPVKVDYLNSSADDAYPTLTSNGGKFYFCSNREGNFDIFKTTIGEANPSSNTFMIDQIISPKNPKTERMYIFSSDNADDKCPYLWNNRLLVFTSNREGGFGGYDIYYSVLENGGWSHPVNAGPRINTAYDEYRPILPGLSNFSYPLMVFSSNRPGGKGGFDLYMTGLVEMDNMGKVKK